MQMENVHIFNIDMRDKKIIVYGAGRLLERYQTYVNWSNVVSIMDKDIAKQGKYVHQMRIESPEKIELMDYDYVAIFTDRFFESARAYLTGNFFVPDEKVVSWRIFFSEDYKPSNERVELYRHYIEDSALRKMIDIGEQRLKEIFMTNERMAAGMDNLGQPRFRLHRNFYKECYLTGSEIESGYDAVFLWDDYERDIKVEDLMRVAQRYIIWTVPYCYKAGKGFSKHYDILVEWGEKRTFAFPDAIVYVFEKKRLHSGIDCKIYVVTHKRYNVLADTVYTPVCVGNEYADMRFCSEHDGDGIPYLNDRINECTALYWIWKNTSSKYVGLNHYRRYFYNNGIKNGANYLSEDKIIEIFSNGFDVILPCLTELSTSVLDNIRNAIGEELGNAALKIVRECIERKAPEYVRAFEHVMLGNVFYRCQMFVAGRMLIDRYCEWLFSFLIDAAEALDVSGYDAHHKRTMGYFAETLLTVWLLEQNVKIKELPITEI